MRSAMLLLAVGSLAMAQSNAGYARVTTTPPSGHAIGGAGFGRIIYPGTGAPAAVRGPGGKGPLYIPPPPAFHPSHPRSIIVPYPVYYGGGYYPFDAPVAPQAADLPQDYAQGAYQQSPVVIINQDFKPDVVNPVVRDYSNVPLPEAVPQNDAAIPPQISNDDGSPTIYLIAMKDRTIFATVAYWVDGETLNYVTREGSLNHASLDLVDRDFSKQLNEERHVEFKLPPSK